MSTPSKSFFLFFWFLSVSISGSGQGEVNGLRTADVNGNHLTIWIPPAMNVTFNPSRLETSNEMSMLYYKFSGGGNETIYGLHWYVYVSDLNGQLIDSDSWWDKGEWSPHTETKDSTVFTYKNQPGRKLIIILQEMVSNAGVRRVTLTAPKQQLAEIVAGNKYALPQTEFIAQVDISEEDERTLVKRAFNYILENRDLKRRLLIEESQVLYVANDSSSLIQGPNVVAINQDQIKDKLRNGEPIGYFEYCGLASAGNSVDIIINYHMHPGGGVYVDKGISVTASYSKKYDLFKLKAMRTVHF